MRHELRVYDADWCCSAGRLSLVGLYSRPTDEGRLRVYQHRDGTSQRRRGCILLLMLVRRAAHATCLRDLPADAPLDARTRRLNHPRHLVSLHVPSRRRRTCGRPCDVAAWVTGARGTNAKRVRCADAPTRQLASNPVRRGARLAETAIARETAARRRRGGAGSLSLSVPLSPLSVDRRRGAPSSSSKRSARVQLCWHIS